MPAKGSKTGSSGTCLQCGKPIYSFPSRPKRFCSKSCARTHLNRTEANPAYYRDISGARNPMFGKGSTGARNGMYGKRLDKSPRWKGGRKIRKDGYVLVVAPPDHPFPADTHKNGLKYILEHRFVMEQHIGRYLSPDEVVHHIDNNPTNNKIENLRLYSSQAEHIRDAH